MTSGVVIVPSNGARSLRDCLESVLHQTTPPRSVVVIDNASNDDSVEVVGSFEHEASRVGSAITVVREPTNIGFTVAANVGLRCLLSAYPQSDFAVLLAQEATLEPTWCQNVANVFSGDATIGAVGSKIFLPNRLTVEHAGGYLERPRLVGRSFGHHNRDSSAAVDMLRDVEFVTRTAMAVRVTAVKQVGFFQEIFAPGGYDDVDLCTRFRDAGWRVLYCPHAVAINADWASFEERLERLSLNQRNRFIYALRWLSESSFREEFFRAERLEFQKSLPIDERRAFASGCLALLLVLPQAVKSRVDSRLVTSPLLTALIRDFAQLRDELTSARWDS